MSIRGPKPTEKTIRMLCARAAGQCEFPGCRERLFFDNATGKEINNSYIAHIIASNPDGPRGNSSSHELSNNLDNLMLLCSTHHTLIDSNPDEYPEETLRIMKREHEEKIDTVCEVLNKEETEILFFISPIKGHIIVSIPFQKAAEAVIPSRILASKYGLNVVVKSGFDYKTEKYWTDVENQIISWGKTALQGILAQRPNIHFSMFPLAPIPLIIKLGELFGDKVNADVFQKTRSPDTWKWQTNEETNNFTINIENKSKGDQIAVLLSLTNVIDKKRIPSNLSVNSIYTITAATTGVDCIKSEKDLSNFWHAYQKVCEQIINDHGTHAIIYLFPAMPVSASFEIGRRYMQGVYPVMQVYDDDDGFFKTLTIGAR